MKNVIRKETVIINNITSGEVGIIKYQFPDNQNLRKCKLWGIQSFYFGNETQTGLTKIDPDYSLPLIVQEVYKRTFLTLCDTKNIKFLKQAPLVIFQNLQNGCDIINNYSSITEIDTKTFNGQSLDLNNSFIEIAPGAKPFDHASLIINFFYTNTDIENSISKKLIEFN